MTTRTLKPELTLDGDIQVTIKENGQHLIVDGASGELLSTTITVGSPDFTAALALARTYTRKN